MSVCVHRCRCACVLACMHMWKAEYNLAFHSSHAILFFFFFFYFEQILSLAWNSLNGLDWLVCNPQGPACLNLPRPDFKHESPCQTSFEFWRLNSVSCVLSWDPYLLWTTHCLRIPNASSIFISFPPLSPIWSSHVGLCSWTLKAASQGFCPQDLVTSGIFHLWGLLQWGFRPQHVDLEGSF